MTRPVVISLVDSEDEGNAPLPAPFSKRRLAEPLRPSAVLAAEGTLPDSSCRTTFLGETSRQPLQPTQASGENVSAQRGSGSSRKRHKPMRLFQSPERDAADLLHHQPNTSSPISPSQPVAALEIGDHELSKSTVLGQLTKAAIMKKRANAAAAAAAENQPPEWLLRNRATTAAQSGSLDAVRGSSPSADSIHDSEAEVPGQQRYERARNRIAAQASHSDDATAIVTTGRGSDDGPEASSRRRVHHLGDDQDVQCIDADDDNDQELARAIALSLKSHAAVTGAGKAPLVDWRTGPTAARSPGEHAAKPLQFAGGVGDYVWVTEHFGSNEPQFGRVTNSSVSEGQHWYDVQLHGGFGTELYNANQLYKHYFQGQSVLKLDSTPPLLCEVLGHTVMDDGVMLRLAPSFGDEIMGSLSTMPLRRVLQDGSCSSGACTVTIPASPQTDDVPSTAPKAGHDTPAEASAEAVQQADDSSEPPHANAEPKGAEAVQAAFCTVPNVSQQPQKASLSPATVRQTKSAWDKVADMMDDDDDDDLMVDLSGAGIVSRFTAGANVPVTS